MAMALLSCKLEAQTKVRVRLPDAASVCCKRHAFRMKSTCVHRTFACWLLVAESFFGRGIELNSEIPLSDKEGRDLHRLCNMRTV